MPCGITQCYLPPGRGDFPAKMLLQLLYISVLTCIWCLVQERYPSSEEFDTMQAFFDQYGTVAHIERRVPVRNNGWVGRVCCWHY